MRHMVKIVYMHSRRAMNYDMSYADSLATNKHSLGDLYIIPADARLDGIEDD